LNETQHSTKPDRFQVDGHLFSRLWRAGSKRSVVVQRHGTRFLMVPLNLGILLLVLLLIGTAPLWPLVAVAAIVALLAKVEVVVLCDAPPAP
jgi:hypothetical protein